MARVHPNRVDSDSPAPSAPAAAHGTGGEAAAVLTVWRKSLLLNFDGFTVFDAKGDLVFRVDNYASGSRCEVVLMGAAGEPLLTIRRKKPSLGENWRVYEGEGGSNRPRFSVKKQVNVLQGKALAQVVTPCGVGAEGGGGGGGGTYEVEGSYARRCCAVYDEQRRVVAEIKRKEAAGGVRFGDDVFRLVVQPGFDAAVAMAIVVVLEQMFG